MTFSEDGTRVILSGCPKFNKCRNKLPECRPRSYDAQEVAELLGIHPDFLPEANEGDYALGWPEETPIKLAIEGSELAYTPVP